MTKTKMVRLAVATGGLVGVLAAKFGWDLPWDVLYGLIPVVIALSPEIGGAVKKGVEKAKGNAKICVAFLLACALCLAVPGCNTVRAGLAAGQQVLSRYVVVSDGDFDGKVCFNSKYVVIDGTGAGEIRLKDIETGKVVFRYPVQGTVKKAWEIVIVDDKVPLAFRDADVADTLAKLDEAPPSDPAVVVEP